MNILEIENKRQELIKKISAPLSDRIKVILISEYYNLLFNKLTASEISPFLLEFLDEYSSLIGRYEPEGIELSISENLYAVLEKVIAFTGSIEQEIYESNLLQQTVETFGKKIENAKSIITGKILLEHKFKFFFPLLDNNPLHDDIISGILETSTVKIYPADEQKFIVVPSEKEIENNLQGQIENSWEAAKKLLKKFTRKQSDIFHIIIQFDKRVGFYHGNSLGAALTLKFLQTLLNYYNTPSVVNTAGHIAFTGGMGPDGSFLPTSDDLIQQKVEIVFFTGINILVTAKENENAANHKLTELKEKYPVRDLRVIGIIDAEDLLNRRNIVEIKRQNSISRTIKYVRKNPIILTLLFIMIATFIAYNSIIWDTNPDNYSMKGDILFIKNKIGQTLWTCKMRFSMDVGEQQRKYNKCCRIVDINNDGINEVITALEQDNVRIDESSGKVTCYNNNQKVVWSYIFRDSVQTATIDHSRYYSSQIVDTATINGQKFLYLIAKNAPLYPNAIYRLELQTGKRAARSTLWNSGALNDAIIGDFNEDNKIEIAAAGGNNGFERAVFFTINIDEIDYCQMPSPTYYTFTNFKGANFNDYILFPQTDYSYYYKNRYNLAKFLTFNKNSKRFEIWVDENFLNENDPANVLYFFDSDLKLKMIDCGDDFSFNRDDLIRKGKLKPPFTNTAEFFGSLKKEVRYLKQGDDW